MSYINFKAKAKNVKMKPKGVTEIVLEVSGDELDGMFERLAKMVDREVQVELESMIVDYKVEVNQVTRKPIIDYQVRQDGTVMRVNIPEQLELEGLPEEEIKTEEAEQSVSRQVVDEFILSDMAPIYEDCRQDIVELARRRIKGESYITLADFIGISSGKIVEIIEGYRSKVAPIAQKWHEWKEDREEKKKEE